MSESLVNAATTIRNENAEGANTAQRVGDAILLVNEVKADASGLNSSISAYFFGKISVNFTDRKISFPKAYFSYGDTLRTLESQEISYSVDNSLRIFVDKVNYKWIVADVTQSITNDKLIYMGVIDMGGKTCKGNFRSFDLGKYNDITNIGYLIGSTFKIDISFNDSGFTLTNTSGYCVSNQGGLAMNLPSSTYELKTKNFHYVYFKASTNALLIYSYDSKPEVSFSDCYFIGTITPNQKTALLNVSRLVINGVEKLEYNSLKDNYVNDSYQELFKSENATLPVESWISKGWNTNLDKGFIFIDKRNKINKCIQLKSIQIYASNAGNVNVCLLDYEYNIISSTQKALIKGINNVFLDNIEYTTEMYVGIDNVDGILTTVMPYDNIGNGTKINVSTSEITGSNYSYSYELDVLDYSKSVSGRIQVLEDRYMPTTSDINKLLMSNDTVVLQPRDYLVTEPIVLSSGKELLGSFGKTNLILSNGNTKAITGYGLTNIRIANLHIKGTQPNYSYSMNGIDSGENIIASEEDAISLKYMGEEQGIYLESCESVILENIGIHNISGSGIRANKVGKEYIKGLKAVNVFIDNCYNGIYGENEHEFSNYTNIMISLCQVGITFNSGNLMFNNGSITRCRVGLMPTKYGEGDNHAHGLISDLQIKHNQIAGILCNDITNGEMFGDIYISYADLIIRNSTGLYFDALKMGGGNVVCTNDKNVAGKNVINSFVRRTANANVNNTGNLEILNTINLF